MQGYTQLLNQEAGNDVNSNLFEGTGLPNFAANVAAALRLEYADQFVVGNTFTVVAGRWGDASAPGVPRLRITRFAFGSAIDGIFVRTSADKDLAAVNGYGLETPIFYVPRYTTGVRRDQFQAYIYNRADNNTRTLALEFTEMYYWRPGTSDTALVTPAMIAAIAAAAKPDLHITIPGQDWSDYYFDGPFDAIRDAARAQGPVFRSIKRISQHICAPVINPNYRIGAIAPLNHDTRHLPPELRDFQLTLYDADWSRLRAANVIVRSLHLYEFSGGNQKSGAEQTLLYLPQFQLHEVPVAGDFETTVYSSLGSPSFFCFFCRSTSSDILQQPKILNLSIQCETTSKKSNVVTDLSIGQLYHLTQRNVHPTAEYDRVAFNRRQTVLLSTEDIGLVGLRRSEYQSPKRVRYNFSGSVDVPGQLNVLFVYSNRGLHIDGKRLQIVNLYR